MSEKQLKAFDRLLYFCLGVTVVIAIVAGAIWINNRVNAMVQEVTPEQCQYPTRPLVNGQCDNSDPCDPTTLKDPVLHGDCAPASKVDVTSPPQEPSKPQTTSQPAKECGK